MLYEVITARADRLGDPVARGVVGIEGDIEPGIGRRLRETEHVRAPVAGDDRLRAGRLDLGDVGRKVLHLADRVQLVADDLDIGAFLV